MGVLRDDVGDGSRSKHEGISEDAYFEMLEKSDLKLEYWAGTVVGMAGASPEHCRLKINLVGEVFQQLRGSRCEAFNSNQAVYIAQRNSYVFPDLTIACGGPEWVTKRGIGWLINPTVVVEVLSPTTASKDETDKLFACTTLRSVREYLIVYADQYCIKMHARTQADETWRTTIYSQLNDEILLASCSAKLTLDAIYQLVVFLK